MITFHPGYLFRTEPDYDLFVTGPVNIKKDGIAALTGLVETNWVPFTFTINWLFTRVGMPIRFEEGEPICQFFPVPKALVEDVMPEIRDLASDSILQAEYDDWSQRRQQFNTALRQNDAIVMERGWQRYYNHGTLPDEDSVALGHRTRLNVKEFKEVTTP